MEGRLIYLLAATGIALIVFFWIRIALMHLETRRAKRIEKLSRFDAIQTKAPGKANIQETRKAALEGLETRFSIVRRTFLAIVLSLWLIVVVAPFLSGVPTTLISIFVTAGAVIIGIAARPLVENFIAGFVLTFSKQFHTGDTVLLDKEYGTIEDITPTHTIIKLWDWRRYIVPNSGMLAKEVLNFSTKDSFLWAKIEFFVSHDADLSEVEKLAVEIAAKNPYLAGEETPQFWVMGLEEKSVKCWLAMWTKSPSDAWAIRTEVGKELAIQLKARGIATHLHLHRPSHPMAEL